MWQPHGVYLFSPAEPLRFVSLSPEDAVLTDTVSSFSKRIMRIYSIKVETVSFFREHSYLRCFDGDIFCVPIIYQHSLGQPQSAIYSSYALFV
jgi:hypothetical protein